MDNADRRNIHAAHDMPRRRPGDDGIGLSKIARRSGYETLRPVPLGLSRTEPVPCRRRGAEMYGLATDRASPTWGRTGKNLCVSAKRAKTDAFSAAPWPLPPSAPSSRRDGQGHSGDLATPGIAMSRGSQRHTPVGCGDHRQSPGAAVPRPVPARVHQRRDRAPAASPGCNPGRYPHLIQLGPPAGATSRIFQCGR